MKKINISLTDDLYFKLVEWKGKLKATSWAKFFEKVIEKLEEQEEKKA